MARLKVIGVTSGSGGAGKTFVATNLAVGILQQVRGGVLFLDASAPCPGDGCQRMGLPRTKSVSRNLQLKLVGAATFVEPVGSGRIGLPASHRNAVGIERKAVLLGMGDKFELWSEQAHLAQIRQTLTDADLGDVPLDLQL